MARSGRATRFSISPAAWTNDKRRGPGPAIDFAFPAGIDLIALTVLVANKITHAVDDFSRALGLDADLSERVSEVAFLAFAGCQHALATLRKSTDCGQRLVDFLRRAAVLSLGHRFAPDTDNPCLTGVHVMLNIPIVRVAAWRDHPACSGVYRCLPSQRGPRPTVLAKRCPILNSRIQERQKAFLPYGLLRPCANKDQARARAHSRIIRVR